MSSSGRHPAKDVTNEAISRLLACAIEAADSGVSSEKAGWTTLTEEELAKARRVLPPSAVETDERGRIRIVVRSAAVTFQLKAVLPEFGRQFEHLLDSSTQTRQDIARRDRARRILEGAVGQLSRSKSDWAGSVLLGWWRMIESNGVDAPIDRVLAEGFSPKSWTQLSTRASTDLALVVAQSAAGSPASKEEAVSAFSKLPSCEASRISLNHLGRQDLERVERVLDWTRFVGTIPQEVLLALGFGWYVRLAWDSSNSIPHDNLRCSELSEALDGAVLKLAGTTEAQFEQAIEQAVREGFLWAAGLLTWPHINE